MAILGRVWRWRIGGTGKIVVIMRDLRMRRVKDRPEARHRIKQNANRLHHLLVIHSGKQTVIVHQDDFVK